jgi:hypothetical protein
MCAFSPSYISALRCNPSKEYAVPIRTRVTSPSMSFRASTWFHGPLTDPYTESLRFSEPPWRVGDGMTIAMSVLQGLPHTSGSHCPESLYSVSTLTHSVEKLSTIPVCIRALVDPLTLSSMPINTTVLVYPYGPHV